MPTPLWAFPILLVAAGTFAVWPDEDGQAARRAPTAAARAADTVAAAGTVRSADTRELAFGSSGTVRTLSVRVGDKVKAGQVLARLDDTQAREQLQVAEAALDAAIEARDEQGDERQEPSGGCDTRTGAVAQAAAYTPSPSPSPSTTSTRPTPSAGPSARPSATRSPRPQPSPTRGGTPGGGGGGCQAQSTAPGSGGQQSEAQREAQAEAQVTRAQIGVREARRALSGTRLTAPIDGTVLAVAGTTGTRVSGPGSSGFVTLGDLDELQVEGMFSQSDVARLKIGQSARITVSVRPGEEFGGTVVHIDPAATADGNLVRYGVKVSFDDAPDGLLIGMNARVTVTP